MYFCVVLCIVCFVTFPVLFVCICVLNYCHRVATQLQLKISYHHHTSTILWGITPCSLLGRRQRFETYCVHVQGSTQSIFFINVSMAVFLFNIVIYVFLLLCLYSYCMFMYLHRTSWHSSATLTEGFPCSFLSCKANARV